MTDLNFVSDPHFPSVDTGWLKDEDGAKIACTCLVREIPDWFIERSGGWITQGKLTRVEINTEGEEYDLLLIERTTAGFEIFLELHPTTEGVPFTRLLTSEESLTFHVSPSIARALMDHLFELGGRTQIFVSEKELNSEEEELEKEEQNETIDEWFQLRLLSNSLKITEHLNAMLNNEMSQYRGILNQVLESTTDTTTRVAILDFKEQQDERDRKAFEELQEFSTKVHSN